MLYLIFCNECQIISVKMSGTNYQPLQMQVLTKLSICLLLAVVDKVSSLAVVYTCVCVYGQFPWISPLNQQYTVV